MTTQMTRLLIVGGGPGGYVAAIRAAQLGIDTTLIEGARLGGTCLNVGCIPSKAWIHAAEAFEQVRHYAAGSPLGIRVAAPAIDVAQTLAWKDGVVARLTEGIGGLLKKHGVNVVTGWARIVDGKTVEVRQAQGGTVRLGCEHLLLATGSKPVELPALPFGGTVISSTEALSPTVLPARLVVVGGGYIGLELGTVYRKLGVAVTVVEAGPRILPAYDAELTQPVAAALRRLGVEVRLGASVVGLAADGKGVRIRPAAQAGMPAGGGSAADDMLPADQVLVAVGRQPHTQGWGLERLPLERNGKAIRIDDRCHTSMHNVWAIGDVTGEPMLAHRAMAQGEMVAEQVAGKRRHFAPAAIPAVCFTDPEIVVAGLSPRQAEAEGLACVSASFPFAANGRALTLAAGEGFVRVVARRDDHRIVGWQAVGQGVSELAAVFTHAIEMGERLEDAGAIIHAHPTLGEAVQEAALRGLGHALHI